MNSMITTTTWVRRGVAAQFPTKYEIDEAEINRISEIARMQLEDAKGDLNAAKKDADVDAMDEDETEKSTKKNSK